MVVLSLLSHPSCLAASIVSVLGLSQARLFLLVQGGGGICSSGSARSVLGELSPGVSKRLAGLSVVTPKHRGRVLIFLGHINRK